MSNRSRRPGARSPRVPSFDPFHEGAEGDATGHRPHRLEAILHEQLQSILRDEASDPALDGVVLVSLRLSIDGGHARIAYAVQAPLGEAPLGEAARVEQASRAALVRATGFLRARLADLLHLKRLPTLAFTFVGVQAPGGAKAGGEGGAPWPA
jgi:ribosome-binding factor A